MPTMQLTADMKHVLEALFGLPTHTVLHQALDYNGYADPESIVSEVWHPWEDLEYPDNKGALVKIPTGAVNLLKSFQLFVYYQNKQGIKYCNDYWTNMTWTQFNKFRY